MDLIEIGNRILMFPDIEEVRRNDEFYVSTSYGVKIKKPWGDQIYGACHRKEWYRFKGYQPSNPPSPEQLRKMYWGNFIGDAEIELYKKAGLWIASEVRGWIPEYSTRLRIDCFVRNPDSWSGKELIAMGSGKQSVVGVELKSTWMYGARGTIEAPAGQKLWPKWEHIIQAAIYHWFFRTYADYWKIVYLARDSGKAREHTLLVTDKDEISVNGEMCPFTVTEIFGRLRELAEKLQHDTVPAREFHLVWDKETLKHMADAGELNKTDTEKVRKGHKVVKGDWECKYCDYARLCWNQVELPYDLTLDKILK